MGALDDIFLAAREITDAGERAAYLSRACGADVELRARLEELLRNVDAVAHFFGTEESRDTASAGHLTEKPGTVIGRYKLLEQIGEGGMGVVYMAEQREPIIRRVALKIIKPGMDTRQVVARFEAERQALALMDHPNIARVLDGGVTETGRPYFVMELVQGVPITQFCEENRLSIEERLNLFISVCQAIQSAHQKAIIHRDLKPSNVLVTKHNGAPHPMVIDFGVARAVSQKLTEKTFFTNFGTIIGTPAYMSPEQAEMSKLDVDTRSDIYSLGVLLYELLTGTTPFPEERLRSVAFGEMQRIIAEEEPERPSTRLRKKATTDMATPLVTRHPPLATDLDWIVMKCLKKDRNRRYETASGLASDLKSHLGHAPVLARPPSAAYRLQKTIRRHRLAFVAGGAVALALLGGIAVSSRQAVRATRSEQHARNQEQLAGEQARLAKEQSETAQAVKDFLTRNLLGGNFRREGREYDPLDVDTKRLLALRIARKIEGQFTNQPLVEAEFAHRFIRHSMKSGTTPT